MFLNSEEVSFVTAKLLHKIIIQRLHFRLAHDAEYFSTKSRVVTTMHFDL